MYATIIEWHNGARLRSSFFQTESEAIAYAARMPGIIAVEEIDGTLVWERKPTQTSPH